MILLIFWTLIGSINASLITSPSPIPTRAPNIQRRLEKREAIDSKDTCGYLNGNALSPRIPASGYFCGKNTQNNLWGFCSTGIDVADCWLLGYCVDQGACFTGCGVSGLTSTTCQSYCYSEFLVSNDQTYTYITCSNTPGSPLWLAVPTTTSPDSETVSSSSQASVTVTSTGGGQVTTKYITSTKAVSSKPSTSSAPTALVDTKSPSNNLPVGSIIGGALGGLSLILLTMIALVILKRRYASTPKAPIHEPNGILSTVADTSGIHEINGNRGDNQVWKMSAGAFPGNGRREIELDASELDVGREAPLMEHD
ncbi:hypothetical protein NHQ30_009471 [Ciborinia camelliae]|nr:hypothetical protein NHQ30_009471 [Ciborinia camelliae]